MDLNLLPIFHAVADARSFSGAAKRLRIPKSSVSRGIAALEHEVGAQLLHRTTRQVALSSAGAALYEQTAPLVKQLRAAVESLPEAEEEPSGLLRITAPVDFTAVLADATARFVARYPEVQVDVRPANRVIDLVAEGFDAGIRASAGPLASSALVARKLSGIEMQLYASPTYLARRGTPRTLQDTADHDWVRFPKWFPLPGLLKPPFARVVADDFIFLRAAIVAGAGLGVLPTYLVGRRVIAGDLVRVVPRYSETRGMLSLVYPGSRHIPRKLAAFRDFLLEYLAANPLTSA